MLLNLSNHPAEKWLESQRQIAIDQYGSVQDLPFPHISPAAKSDEVALLVEKYYHQIRQLDPTAVHLMGEMTFTFALVQRLKAVGIPCVASTTERLVTEENGQKVVQFQFVQFRPY